MKILNLYAGIGGNRKLWGDEHEITAVEINPAIAKIYKDFFPNDTVIVGDAHEFLLKHYKEFEFIWSSPPCVTHSTMAKLCGVSEDFGRGNHKKKPKFPDMKLYEEIIFLQNYYKGLFVVENVRGYYKPLIEPRILQRHFFWCNFPISDIKIKPSNIKWGKIKEWQEKLGFDLSKYKKIDKRKLLRNCVNPKLALHILNNSLKNDRN